MLLNLFLLAARTVWLALAQALRCRWRAWRHRANAALLLAVMAVAALALPSMSQATLVWQVCEHPQLCFASKLERQTWAKAHSCQFLEDVCDQAPASSDNKGADEADQGFWGALWSGIKSGLVYGYEFVKGLVAGLKDQVTGLVRLLTGLGDVLDGLIQLGKSFYQDPKGTLLKLGEVLGQDVIDSLTRATLCGPYDQGKVIGQSVSPILVAKLATKISRYAGDLGEAVKQSRIALGCASFAADTPVLTPEGPVPIDQIVVGQRVQSRSESGFIDAAQVVTRTFKRSVDHYRRLVTEFGALSVTEEHPLWVQGRGWAEVGTLQRGDIIATSDGDVAILHNERLSKPLAVVNFSVEQTPSYFVGHGVWAHNANCELPSKLYRAISAKLTYRIGASDGGPGVWSDRDALKKLNHPDHVDYRYQSEVTGAPRNVEYHVNGTNFDGYDPDRIVLIDTKRFEPGNPLTDPKIKDAAWVAGFKAKILAEARGQVRAADGTGATIEWHVSGRAEAAALRDLLIKPSDREPAVVGITIVWTPRISD